MTDTASWSFTCGEFDRSACTRNSSKNQDMSISQDASIRSGAARMCLFKSISLYIHRVHALTYYILDSSIRHTSMSRRYSAYSDLACYQRRQLRRAHVLGRPHSRWSTLEPPSCAAASCITALALRGTARECTRLEVVEGLRRQSLPDGGALARTCCSHSSLLRQRRGTNSTLCSQHGSWLTIATRTAQLSKSSSYSMAQP